MKKGMLQAVLIFLGILFYGILPASVEANFMGCKLSVDLSVNTIDGRNNASSVKPGDTICVLAGQRLFLRFSHLHGSETSPIVIINSGGKAVVTGHVYGIKIDSCSHVIFSGQGEPEIPYGFFATQVNGAGISIDGLSTNIEVKGVEIGNTTLVGMFAKTDPDTTFTSTREKYTLRNLVVHDNYIHHTGMEGMYIGSTFYLGKTIPYHGKDTIVFPHLLRGVNIYHNIVEYTAWDGIQVSSADSGCSIHDNYIFHDSEAGYLNQMSGILDGGGSRCDCYNNRIIDGKGDGIEIFSLGNQRIYNNLITNAGRTFYPDMNYSPYLKHGIYIGEYLTVPGSTYTVAYNTIIAPKTYGIRIANYHSDPNLVSNNIIVNPGGYSIEGEKSYVGTSSSTMHVLDYNNLKNIEYTPIQFLAPENGNFDLKPGSPAVNKGIWMDFQIPTDVLSRNRPFAALNDIGAFECQDSSLLDVPDHEQANLLLTGLSPNPFVNFIHVVYIVNRKSLVNISISDSQGKVLITPVNLIHEPGIYKKTINNLALPPGLYIFTLYTNQDVIIKKIISRK